MFIRCIGITACLRRHSLAVVGRDFIPGFDRIAKLRIFPPITATADAHEAFIGYGASILDGMLQKGEISHDSDKTVEKTNVSDRFFRSGPLCLIYGLRCSQYSAPEITLSSIAK